MTKIKALRNCLVIGILILLSMIGLFGCQTQGEVQPAQDTISPSRPEQDSPSIPQVDPVEITKPPEESTPDPAAIEAAWQSSPHAETFVQDAEGNNNTCARCHAPINWMPSIDELPESCFACKFELEDPPSFISEDDWTNIPCNVCHKVDKKNKVQPDFAWLEIAPIGEYSEVASITELCLKCHAPTDIPGHGGVQLGGAHADYLCTDCHSAHDTTTSCDEVGCHNDVVEPATPIAGHDEDHQAVTCVACHDGGGMDVGPNEEAALWTTFSSGTMDASTGRYAFTSHNVVLDASCDRCHYANNPWGLSKIGEAP